MATGNLYPNENISLGQAAGRVKGAAGGLGLLCLIIGAAWGAAIGDHGARFFHSYITSFTWVLCIAVGALFFVILQHLVKSEWSVVVRRLAEILASTFPLLAALSLVILVPILLGNKSLYLWSDMELVAHDHLLSTKTGWLNPPFFVFRVLAYFAVWIGMAKWFVGKSIEQDRTGDPRLTDQMRRCSGPVMILFSIVVALAAFDLLMSLEPHWFSTIFGVYYFGGASISIYAGLVVFAVLLQRSGRLTQSVTVEHYHDLGKLLFGFILFWAYSCFSQFMLIWYANLPEETGWFDTRMNMQTEGGLGFGWLSLFLLFFHFMIPFVCLMSRWTKRLPLPIGNKKTPLLVIFAAYMLLVHWFDMYWLCMPSYDQPRVEMPTLVFHPIDGLVMVGLAGLFIAAVAHAAGKVNLLANKDPNLGASQRFLNQ